MSNFISSLENPSNNRPLFTVRLHVPYLDAVFESVPDDLIGTFLETTLSVLFARYSRWDIRDPAGQFVELTDSCDNVEQFIALTDNYEEQVVNQCIFAALDYEIGYMVTEPPHDWVALQSERYYYTIESILTHYQEFIIDTLNYSNEDQVEFLISVFERERKICIRYFSYDPTTSDLYLFIPG